MARSDRPWTAAQQAHSAWGAFHSHDEFADSSGPAATGHTGAPPFQLLTAALDDLVATGVLPPDRRPTSSTAPSPASSPMKPRRSRDWEGATVLGGDVAAGIHALKRSPGGDILLLGSPTLVRWLLSRGLLEQLALTIFPIVVGSGPRLFQDMAAERVGLRLTDSRALVSGALSLRYAPAKG